MVKSGAVIYHPGRYEGEETNSMDFMNIIADPEAGNEDIHGIQKKNVPIHPTLL